MSNMILKRIYYAIDVELASPMNTSSGNSIETDSDLLKNSMNEYYLPGSSIAGALRARLTESDKKCIAGFSQGDEGRMSSLFISDLYFDNGGVKSVRDGVKLTDEKTVDNKFDMEVLETGAKGVLFINYVLREKDDDKTDLIDVLITDIQNGYIRFGANKNRGYGRMVVNNVHKAEFDKQLVDALLDFNPKDISQYTTHETYSEWKINVSRESDDFVKIVVPLKLTGGISIRKYSARPNEADFEQITISKKDKDGNPIPVIPGTSWNGAFRSDALSILKELGDEDAKSHVDQWFGFVDTKEKKAQQSLIVFGESIITDSHPLIMTRNRINRFDASTTDGSLYTEKSFFEGKTTLEIMIKKEKNRNYEALIGLLLIAIKDVQNGCLPVGGQTAVGRGIFEADSECEVVFENAADVKNYKRALYNFIKKINMEVQNLNRIEEAPKKGFILAYLREEVLFEKYSSIEDAKDKIKGKRTLEVHMFDKYKEYRFISSTSKRFPEGKIECVIDFEDSDDTYRLDTLMDQKFSGVAPSIAVLNHLIYDENGALIVDNYRLVKEV